jgi:endoglucanase
MNTLPSDPTANRMMVEIHYYEPWQFTALAQDESWGNMSITGDKIIILP